MKTLESDQALASIQLNSGLDVLELLNVVIKMQMNQLTTVFFLIGHGGNEGLRKKVGVMRWGNHLRSRQLVTSEMDQIWFYCLLHFIMEIRIYLLYNYESNHYVFIL